MSARQPQWSDLHVFLAAARGGTLASAAEVLRVNPSTVQRRIGKLEEDLATRLFDRSQRGYSLTSTGEELLAHALEIEEHVHAVARKVGGRDQRLEGTVRVATVDDLAIRILNPIIIEFRAEHPAVTIDVAINPSYADLARQQAHVALRIGPKPRMGDVVAKHVGRVLLGLYATRAYLAAHGRPETPEDLRDHAVVRGGAVLAPHPMERTFDRFGDPSKIAYRSDSMLARFVAVRDGIGIGLVPYFMARPDPTLEHLELDLGDFGSDLWLLVHADLRTNARVRAFVDFAYPRLVEDRERFIAPSPTS